MARPSNTEQRKAEIVQALLTVMATKGYEKASIQAIAQQAGLRPGLIHYHFKTKQDILIALVNWIADRGAERLQSLASDDVTALDKLKAYINACLATGDGRSPELVSAWIVIAAESVKQAEIKPLYQDLIKSQLQLLQRLIGDAWPGKTVSSKEVVQLAAMTTAAIEGAFQLSVSAEEVMPKGYAAEGIIGLIEARIK